jgi:hypothetical protein
MRGIGADAAREINFFECTTKATGSRLSPGASGEFGSHAIRPRSSHHMQVMTVESLPWPQQLLSSWHKPTMVIPACAGMTFEKLLA